MHKLTITQTPAACILTAMVCLGVSSLAPVGPGCHGARPAVHPAWLLPRGCPGLPRRSSTAKHGPSARAQATGQAKASSGGLCSRRSSHSQRSERRQRRGGCHGGHAEASRGDDAIAHLQSLRRLHLRTRLRRAPVRLPSRDSAGDAPRSQGPAPGRTTAGRAAAPRRGGAQPAGGGAAGGPARQARPGHGAADGADRSCAAGGAGGVARRAHGGALQLPRRPGCNPVHPSQPCAPRLQSHVSRLQPHVPRCARGSSCARASCTMSSSVRASGSRPKP